MIDHQDILTAHKHSSWHRQQFSANGVVCGCFNCCRIFPPASIEEWVDNEDSGAGQTAMCPYCGIDSVIGTCSGYPVTVEFLTMMKRHWFGED